MGRLGSLLFGFCAGSVVTAAAAYIVMASDMERLKKEKKELEEELDTAVAGPDAMLRSSRGVSMRSAAAAVAASGEHAGFLTDILKQLWGYIKEAGATSIKETVEPMFKEMMPSALSSLHFTKIDLGSVPIRMDNIVVHKVDAKSNTLQFDLDLIWDGNCDIQLKAGLIAFGVRSVKLRGRMCIVMRPLTTDLSIVSGIQYTFINPPDLELDFTGLAQVADFKIVDKQIRKIIQDILATMLVLPERMLYKMDPACSFLDIYRKPLGIACLKVERGRGFVVEKRAMRKDDVPDCFCNVKLGNKSIRTKTIKDNLSPFWNESHDFLMCDMDQIVFLEAWDEDGGAMDPDDPLGKTSATLGEIMLNGGRKEFPLVDDESHKPNGASVTLGCDVVNFTSDLKSLKDTKEEDCFAGVLIILVVGASDIPLKKEEAETFVRVDYEKKSFVTGAVVSAPGVDALNPVYDLAFHLPLTPSMVKDGKMKDLTLSLMNGEKVTLGNTAVTHDQVAAAPENVLTETRPVGKGGAKVTFRVALHGVDRKAKIQARGLPGAVKVAGDATSEDYVSVEPGVKDHTKVRVTAVSGQGFQIKKKKSSLRPLKKADVPDVYCIIKVGTTASAWRTKTIKDNVAPVWNESKEYPFVNHGQIINIEVWDENKGRFTKDDFYGSTRVTVGEFLLKGGSMELELHDEGKPTGLHITFKCELID